MEWVSLSVALCAFIAAGLAHREATRSSSRKLLRTVNEALEDVLAQGAKLKREWAEELERLQKQARRTGATLRRLETVLEEGDESAEGTEGGDPGELDARGGDPQPMRSLPANVARGPWRAGRAG